MAHSWIADLERKPLSDALARAARRSPVHQAMLALVWLSAATSGFVFSEPCPTDLVTMALIVLLPAAGLVRFGPALSALLMVFSAAAFFGLLATIAAVDQKSALIHMLVSLYLYGATVVLAGFIALKPVTHTRLIFRGTTIAAVIAAALGILGYFGLLPSGEMFTKFGRVSGTFKDPNVFGPFLVAPFLYTLHSALERPLLRAAGPLAIAGFLALGVFLSFSRGAWINLMVATGLFVVLSLFTAPTIARRQKIVFLSAAGTALVVAGIIAATQIEQVSRLLSERASTEQAYDVGPEGRFGGQEKAVNLILEHPLGIGAAQFALVHHHEEPHNVYLSMALNAGWFGAGFYVISVLATLGVGLLYAFRRSDAQPFLLIALAVFAANVAEGIIIDTDHWRHFYLMMAMIWGISTAPQAAAQSLAYPLRRASDRLRLVQPAMA